MLNDKDEYLPHKVLALSHQVAYVEQQQLDGYTHISSHAHKQKLAFDRKVLSRAPREVIFKAGQLVQVYRSDLDFTFKAEWKMEQNGQHHAK